MLRLIHGQSLALSEAVQIMLRHACLLYHTGRLLALQLLCSMPRGDIDRQLHLRGVLLLQVSHVRRPLKP